MFSFHATKLFHTGEGGCLVYRDVASVRSWIFQELRHTGRKLSTEAGLNAKLSELQCAVGLAMINEVEPERSRRQTLRARYVELLGGVDGLTCITVPADVKDSLQYMAVRVDAEVFGITRDELYRELLSYNVYSRRYFHPLCTDYAPYRNARAGDISNARLAAQQVLCLPFYGEMGVDAVDRICEILVFIRDEARRRTLI
jgi:dTDP-4-amino-4,6-dideoxygalactose transaminase